MILATVGTQLPFSRLIATLDEIAPALNEEVVAQIGKCPIEPSNMKWQRGYDPREFESLFLQASRIVAHAGIGTILAAKKHRKPIILMARRAALNEHRNDHQLATVAQLRGHAGIYVADTAEELQALLNRNDLTPASETGDASLAQLQSRIRSFVHQN